MESTHPPIPGWGIDRDIRRRPGYPLDQEHHVDHDTLQGRSPAATTVPLKGLSGVLRRAAYRVPDWKPRRWLMLIMADRLDALESKLTLRNLVIGGGIAGLFAAVYSQARARLR